MFCIKEALSLGEDIIKYISSMPSPTYQYARYTDWIFQFWEENRKSKGKESENYISVIDHVQRSLEKYSSDLIRFENELREKHSKLYDLNDEELNYSEADIEMKENKEDDSQTSKQQDKDEENIENVRNLAKEEMEQTEYKSLSRPYVIAKVLSEVETDYKQEEELRVVLSELICEFTWNKPLGKKQNTKDFFDHYKFRKASVQEWKKQVPKQTVFSKKAGNENFVNLGQGVFNKQKEEEESMQQEDEESNLRPIWEDYEGSEDENEKQKPYQQVRKPNNDECKAKNDNDDIYDSEFNQQINDREEEEIPELINQEYSEPEYEQIPDLEMQKDDEEKKEEKIEEHTESLYDTNSVILRLSVYNFCNKKIKIEVKIRSNSDSPNFHVPECSIKAEIPANKSKTLAYFHKIHPYHPFGEYYFEYVSDISAKDISDKHPGASNEQAQGGNTSEANTEMKVWPEPLEQFEGMQDEISCEACTLFNPISNTKWDACGSLLPHRK